MTTRAQAIVEAVHAAVTAAAISGVQGVHLDRGDSLGTDALPAVDVTAGDSTVQSRDFYEQQAAHVLTVRVAAIVCETTTLRPSQVADPIVAAAHRAVMGSSTVAALSQSVTLTGISRRLQTTGEGTALRVELQYDIEHVTQVSDLELEPS